MKSRAVLAIPILILIAGTAQAEQAAIELIPKFAADKPLTVEVRNTSKLPVKLTDVTVRLPAGAAGTPPCTFALPQQLAIGPAQMKVISLATNKDVLRCIARPATRHASVITTRDFARLSPDQRAAASPTLQPADVSYKFDIGKHAIADKTAWHFAVE